MNCQHQIDGKCRMMGFIFIYRFVSTIGIAELCADKIWRYVESMMPEGKCADWAQEFWDAAYVALHKQDEGK